MLHTFVAKQVFPISQSKMSLLTFSGELFATSHVILRKQVLVCVCALFNLRLVAKVNFLIV